MRNTEMLTFADLCKSVKHCKYWLVMSESRFSRFKYKYPAYPENGFNLYTRHENAPLLCCIFLS